MDKSCQAQELSAGPSNESQSEAPLSLPDEINCLNPDAPLHETETDERNNSALYQFSQQLAKILSEAEDKIKGEAAILNSNISANLALTFEQERNRHSREKVELLQELKSLYKLVDSLESVIERKTAINQRVVERLQSQRNLLVCSKVFYAWKLHLQSKKHEVFAIALADRHYEANLKRKAFRWWLAQVKARWKNRLELRAHMDVIEMQRHITNLYETKIRGLEDNLSEAGKTIDNLQNQRLIYKDVLSSHLPGYQQANLNAHGYSKEPPIHGPVPLLGKAPIRSSNSNVAVCPECIMEQKSANANYASVPSYQPTSVTVIRDHQTEKPSEEQIMPAPRMVQSSHFNLGQKGAGDHNLRGGRLVIHHPPPSTCSKPSSRPQSGKSYRDKKVV